MADTMKTFKNICRMLELGEIGATEAESLMNKAINEYIIRFDNLNERVENELFLNLKKWRMLLKATQKEI